MRLFTALPLPEELRQQVVLDTAVFRGRYPQLKWVGMDALHITLNFLGEVDEAQLDGIIAAIKRSVEGCVSYPLTLNGFGRFPRGGSPRVVYLAVQEGFDESRQLQQRLAGGLHPLVHLERRRFIPHLTLARVKNGAACPDPAREGGNLYFTFPALRVVLYRSHLSAGGAQYQELESFPIGPSVGP